MFRRNRWHRSVGVAAFVTAFSAAAANAQAVEYREVTRIDMGGLNPLLKLAGVSESVTTTYLMGDRMRTDSDQLSFIVDVETRHFILVDHERRTYCSVPLDQLAADAAALVTSFGAEPASGSDAATIKVEEGTADFHFDVKVEPTAERRIISGHDATRAFLTVETDIEFTPEGEAQSEEVGTFVILMDAWHAEAGPLVDATRAFNNVARDLVMQQAFGRNRTPGTLAGPPGLATAIGKAADESRQLGGLEVQSTTHVVLVPPGMSLDRTALLEPGDEGGVATSVRGTAEEVARDAATDVAEEARGKLPGVLGRRLVLPGKRQAPAAEPTGPEQAIFMTIITEIRDVETTNLPASTFELPAGYREIAAGDVIGS